MAKLSELLRERGYVYQFSSEKLEEITDGPKRTLYLGVDPSADSMQVGQLMGILVLRRFVEAGHTLILLVGGGTGMIGDPGGKGAERNLLDYETIEKNADAIRKQIQKLLGGVEFELVNNADWLREIQLMDFLRDTGKYFTVNEMIKRDSVKPRLEKKDASISFTEFSYMLLQAYDFLHLHRIRTCDLQVGGSDQWGNMVSGVDLIRRVTGDKAYAFSWPLLVDKTTGKKFGKSEGGATVWLDAKKTSPFQFYQFWLNTPDEVVEELLLKMTMLSRDEIKFALELHRRDHKERHAQKILAQEVTELVHGTEEMLKAQTTSDILFGPVALHDLSANAEDVLGAIRSSAPTYEVKSGANIVDVIVGSGLADSKRAARQFLKDQAIVLNQNYVIDDKVELQDVNFNKGMAILKRGKKNVCVLLLK